MRLLDGRKALITGGASGIGAATARLFVEAGAIVIISDIDEQAGESMAEELGADCTYLPHDVTSESSWERVVAQAEAAMGGLNVVVNSAGVSIPASVEAASMAHWRRIMSVNCDGVFLGCKHGVRALRKNGGGSIVNLSSTLGVKASSLHAAYSASKAAVLSITRSTALHCAEQKYDIRCNAVLPGATQTPMLEDYLAALEDRDAVTAQLSSAQPLGRVGRPEDVAMAIRYLVSDEAAFVTGVTLPVDGGFLA